MIKDEAWSPPYVPTTSATAASNAEAIAETDITKFLTPATLAAYRAAVPGPIRLNFTGAPGTATGVDTGGFKSANFGLSTVSGGASYFGGAVTANGGGTTATMPFTSSNGTLGGFEIYSGSATANQRIWQWQAGTAIGDGTIRLRAVNDALSNGSNAISITRTGDAVGTISFGTTTAVVSVLGTTAATNTTSGALVVGSNVGLSGNAGGASYFGGAVTTGGALAITASGQAGAKATITNTDAASYSHLDLSSSSGQNSALYQFGSTYATAGRYVQGSMMLEAGGSGGLNLATSAATPIRFYTNGDNVRLAIASDGAATFAGAVTAASLATTQTAAVAAAVVSTHKVPIVLNGVTYYMLLTNVP